MNSKLTVSTILLVVLGVTLLWAGDPWKERPYAEWTEKECRKLLQDSPWAKRYSYVQVILEMIDPGQIDSVGRGRESNPRIEYWVRLLSALPIRQALVRLQQINTDYDEMPPEQQQAFDQKAEAILNMQLRDTVVLLVDYGSSTDVYDKEMARYWQRQTTETLKNVVFLRGHAGEEVPLLGYAAEEGAGRSFQLVFPRKSEGRPLLRPDSKTLRLDFLHPNIRGQGEVRAFVEFKVKNMLIEGEVVY